MQCSKCSGLMVKEEAHDESFRVLEIGRCLLCGIRVYPPRSTPIPIISKKGGRAREPMFTRPKKIEASCE